MPSFEEIGLREELLRTLEDEEIETPTALQEAVIPPLRRGGNLVARASSGSGKTLAYFLGVLDRLRIEDEAATEAGEEEDDADEPAGARLRVLVLTPTESEAERVAMAAVPYAQALGLQVTVPTGGWGTAITDADVLVAPAADALRAIGSSAVKLDALETIIVDGASAIAELGEWEQVDTLMDLVPRDAQRVVVSPSLPGIVEDLVERRVKRALRYPPEAAIADGRSESPMAGAIGYVVAAEREKLEMLARQLGERDAGTAPPIIFCRTDERAAGLAEQLTVRGFLVGQADEEEADVAIAAGGVTSAELTGAMEGEAGQTISYDVPADVATLVGRHGGDQDAVVLLEARELAHLKEIAALAAFRTRSLPHFGGGGVQSGLQAFRDEITAALTEEDLTPQLLVLEPLLEEFSATEVAAAVTALLRRRRPASGPTPAQRTEARATPAGQRSATEKRSAPAGPAPVTWARLFLSIGSRDEIRPGDIVGAIAGEANVPGSRIGKIEIRDSFSIVEVQADVADQIIRSVNGTTVKGRSVRVDYDRGGPARRPPGRSPGGPRRTTRRPPS